MIHSEILERVAAKLTQNLITDIPDNDPARAGVVKLGDLQGEPDPDIARISITLYENDPDTFISGASTSLDGKWDDEVYDVEMAGPGMIAMTWTRRFTAKCRCLFETTREDLATARQVASTVRSRLEMSLLSISFAGVNYDGEYVARGVISEEIAGEMLQSGGPPDSYDFFIKVRFSVLTTKVKAKL